MCADTYVCFGKHSRGWKDLVDEWVKSAGDVAAAAMAGKLKRLLVPLLTCILLAQ